MSDSNGSTCKLALAQPQPKLWQVTVHLLHARHRAERWQYKEHFGSSTGPRAASSEELLEKHKGSGPQQPDYAFYQCKNGLGAAASTQLLAIVFPCATRDPNQHEAQDHTVVTVFVRCQFIEAVTFACHMREHGLSVYLELYCCGIVR